MSKQGYIKLHRQLQDCWIWCANEKFDRSHAWIDILLSCNHADKKIQFNGKPIVIERGQWLTSLTILADRWTWSRHKVSDFLDALVADNMLVVEKDNKRTLITVVNYDIFQGYDEEKGQQKDSERTAEGHQTDNKRTSKGNQKDTNNNDKNDKECNKNDKEDINGEKSTRFIAPTIEEVKSYCLERKNNVNAENFINFYSSKGWMVGKNKMKDWKAAVRTWETNFNNKKGNVNGTDKGNSTASDKDVAEAIKVYGLQVQ